jgi:hypothetical protein
MATLQQQIAQRFLEKLAESKDVDAAKIQQLKKLLADTAHAARRADRLAGVRARAPHDQRSGVSH